MKMASSDNEAFESTAESSAESKVEAKHLCRIYHWLYTSLPENQEPSSFLGLPALCRKTDLQSA